jgi:nicotinate dehydrogenase subunit A
MSQGAKGIACVVNGKPVQIDADPKMPLALALRNHLGLRGTRLGCEQGACGACTVVIDGRAVQSCDIALDAVAHSDIVTIDALVADDPPHPLVEAILQTDAGQCGFCLAGIIMATVPLYGTPVTEADILAALDRNLCRCGAHTRILKALKSVLIAETT